MNQINIKELDKWAVIWKETGEWISFPTRKMARAYVRNDSGQNGGIVRKVKIKVVK